MNVEMLKKTDRIIFEAVVGSRAYHTHGPLSDIDIRGIFITPLEERNSLFDIPMEVGQEKPIDVKYYDIEKFMKLAKEANPNIIEMLFLPDDCIQICTSKMKTLLESRSLFVSKKAFHTHCGYAFAQIKKMKSENKWISNPKPKEPPKREDFCWFIDKNTDAISMPCRPVQITETEIDLSKCHVSGVEHLKDSYRLYSYGSSAKGVFRDGNLACESIPIEDEIPRYMGILIYNDHEYKKNMLDWKNYHTWVRERNPNRWISQEKGEVDFDCKNAQHCIRLLLSCKGVLENGEPIVRFSGEALQHLKDVRNGKFSYGEIMNEATTLMGELQRLYETCDLPHSADDKGIDRLFRELLSK